MQIEHSQSAFHSHTPNSSCLAKNPAKFLNPNHNKVTIEKIRCVFRIESTEKSAMQRVICMRFDFVVYDHTVLYYNHLNGV